MIPQTETEEIALTLVRMTEINVANKLRFSCAFCGYIQGKYERDQKGFLHIGLCMKCAPHTMEYLEEAAHNHPKVISELVEFSREFKEYLGDVKQ